jgi:hypothetical protein
VHVVTAAAAAKQADQDADGRGWQVAISATPVGANANRVSIGHGRSLLLCLRAAVGVRAPRRPACPHPTLAGSRQA